MQTTDGTPNRPPVPLGPLLRLPFEEAECAASVAARFERVVAFAPDAVAIETDNGQWTFDALNSWANTLAHALIRRGGTESEPVVLLLSHDAPLVAALVGVLKAGKFFCALDPTDPPLRLSSLLDDLGARFLITDAVHAEQARSLAPAGCDVLAIETLGSDAPNHAPAVTIPPEAPAVVVYTSGSSGLAKGVVRLQRTLTQRAFVDQELLDLRSGDRLSFLVPPITASAVTSVMQGLLCGATLLPFPVRREGVTAMADWLGNKRITHLRVVVPLLRQLLAALLPHQYYPDLRRVEATGDVLYRRDVETFRPHVSPECVLVHRYSSSETGMIASAAITADTVLDDDVVPVGQPLPGREVLILDDSGNRLPVGEVGEIAVRSRFMAGGYWRRPVLTALRFAPEPGTETTLYRTGDQGRLRQDGRLEYLGRRDSQVKVRGFNVNLAEVEGAVIRLHGVREAAVIAQRTESGDNLIVAFVVAAPSITASELRLGLLSTLPEVMIPSAFVLLDRLPLTSNGKVDRAALPTPGRVRPPLAVAYAPPTTSTQTKLAAVWEKVLGVDGIGIHDAFSDLGGNSLNATQVVTRVRQTFEVDVRQRLLFSASTIATMAELVDAAREKRAAERLSRLVEEVERLSDEDAERLVAEERRRSNMGRADV